MYQKSLSTVSVADSFLRQPDFPFQWWDAPWSSVCTQISQQLELITGKLPNVKLWQYHHQEQQLKQFYALNNNDAIHDKPICRLRHPGYFAALDKQDVLFLDSPSTQPNLTNITSSPTCYTSIHCPLYYQNQLLGVMCLEFNQTVAQDYSAALLNITQCTAYRMYIDALHQEKHNLQLAFDHANDGIFIFSGNDIVDCNQTVLTMFDCSKEQLLAQSTTFFSPKYQPDGQLSKTVAQRKINLVMQGKTQVFEWQHLRYDRTPFDAEVTMSLLQLDDRQVMHAVVRDISDRKAAETQLEHSKTEIMERNRNLTLLNKLSNQLHGCIDENTIIDDTFEVLLQLTQTPHIAMYLLDGTKQYLNLVKSHGFNGELRKVGARIPLENSLNALSIKRGSPVITNNLATDPAAYEKLKPLVGPLGINAGVFIPLMYQGQALGTLCLLFESKKEFTDSETETYETLGQNVSLALANAQNVRKLEFMAHHDTLTGLPNRAVLHQEFENNIAYGPGMPAVLMLIDLDRFKDINDTLGHYVGDLVLQQISPRISQCTTNYKTLICRLGGDEFSVLIYGKLARNQVLDIADCILRQLRQPINVDSMLLEIDASIGVAFYPTDGKDSHALLRSADVAMYEAKRRGGGVMIYQRESDIHTPERLALMAELGTAIRDDQLVLHFQPKVQLSTNKIIGFEALVRWEHPFSGLLYPDKFIPLAEVSDAIHHLTEKVLDMALAQQQQWRQQGYHFSVAVNLSARNLIDDRCIVSLKQMLEKYQTPAGMLELELTETALMQDPDKAIELLNQLSQLGISLSIDDFGTGYSSLSYLRQLPIDTLKIDRDFVGEMLSNEQDIIIVRSTINLGHNLSLKVVAEGVEDNNTLNALGNMQCDIAQGYHISKPLSWPDIEKWLSSRAKD
ncbi:EAL domain-containing protein [Neptunicella marina]|uniref:EAL domain-containing protein n=1 Tax=Neptunicella marina TaxID=2125989 RepID=A0A8J6M5V8_9ALTE|nr:EAL domain-containing protein [Neptunicella marina]MBC3766776.1 EAL domain-containing protein [Neptunicella marina]